MQEEPMTYRQWKLYQQAWFWAYQCLDAIPDSYSKIKRELKAKLDAMPEPEVVPYSAPPGPDNKPTAEGYRMVALLDDDTTQVVDDDAYQHMLAKRAQ